MEIKDRRNNVHSNQVQSCSRQHRRLQLKKYTKDKKYFFETDGLHAKWIKKFTGQ